MPATDEIFKRDAYTLDAVTISDLVIFVIQADILSWKSKWRDYIHDFVQAGCRNFIFAVNKMDILDEEDRHETVSFAQGKISSLAPNLAYNLVFIKARQALDARIEGDEDLLQSSGFQNLEQALEAIDLSNYWFSALLRHLEELKTVAHEVVEQISQSQIPPTLQMTVSDIGDLSTRLAALLEQHNAH